MYIDSHAHINDEAFDKDREAVIAKTFDGGVEKIIEIACEPAEWQPAIDLSNKYEGQIFCAAGIHPIYASKFTNADFKSLQQFLAHPKTRGIGEIGLDYAWEHASPRAAQKTVLEQMLALLPTYKKPVVMHCRKANEGEDYAAYDDMFAMLRGAKLCGGVLHCFSGRYADAAAALDLGLKIGITGIISYKKNEDLRSTVRKIGLQNLLLETDCPYLPPQIIRGQRNDPSYIPAIAATLAEVLGKPLEEVARITTQNTRELFSLVPH